MKIVVTAGGTGGHIFPALAIIHKFQEKEKNLEILYIGTTDRMEKDMIPKEKIPYLGIEMKGFDRSHVFNNIEVLKIYKRAIKIAKEHLQKFKPDLVIGVGGYITAPVLYAASKLGIKTAIHEQNSIPGLSNQFLSHFVDLIFVSFEESKKKFPQKKTIYTGNPRSEEIATIKKIKKSTLGFQDEKKLVIIVMGSLGSMTMNQKLKEMIPSFKDKDYQVLFITGKDYYESYQKVEIPKNVKIVPFYQDLIRLMKDADLIVTRSGASTIAEITSICLPSIMVPSPYVTHNHQMKNAMALEKDGAALIIEEKDFKEDILLKKIDLILLDEEKQKSMKKALKQRSVQDSATKIYLECKKLVRND